MGRFYQFIFILFLFVSTTGLAQQTLVSGDIMQLDTLVKSNFSFDSVNHSAVKSLKRADGHVQNHLNVFDTLSETTHLAESRVRERMSGIDTIGKSKTVRLKNKADSLRAKLVGKVPENKVEVVNKTTNVDVPGIPTINLGLESDLLKLHEIEIPNADLNNIDQSLKSTIPKGDAIGNNTYDILEKSRGYSGSIDSLKNMKPEKLDVVAEEKVMQLNEVKDLREGIDQIETQKELIEQYKEQLKLEAELKEKAKEVASDVIVQYQSKIQEKIPNLNKYKRRFNFVQDLRNLPKRAPNSVKDLEWRERVIPGLTFYSMNSAELWLQFDPQVVYRLTGNLSAGFGGMYRFSMNNKKFTFSNFENLYGVKIVSSYKIYKGFFIQAEGHRVTYKPWETRLNDPDYKTTVYAVVGGIGNSHAISRRMKGNIQALYHYAFGEDPYRPKVMLKFGMEFSLVKREKPQWELTLKSLRKCK